MRKIDLEISHYIVNVPSGTLLFEVLSKRPYERTKQDNRKIQRAGECFMSACDEIGKWAITFYNKSLLQEDIDNEGIGQVSIIDKISQEEFVEFTRGDK